MHLSRLPESQREHLVSQADQAIHLQAGFGDSLKLVGSLPETGKWDVAAAPEMSWCAETAQPATTSV